MSLAFSDCLKRGKIKPFSRGKRFAPQELKTAEFDLERAHKTFKEGDFKWATIQLYYAMFHAARAMIYSRNFRECSHYCLVEAIRALFVETQRIPVTLLEGLIEAKDLREDADYHSRWSKKSCKKLLGTAPAIP